MDRNKFLLWVGLGVFVFASQEARATVQVTVTEESIAESQGDIKKETRLQPGQKVELDLSEPQLVLSLTSRVPILLVPVFSGDSEVNIDSPRFKPTGNSVQLSVSQLLSDLMIETEQVKNQIKSGNLKIAMQQLDSLKKRHPSVKFFEFLRGSVFYLLGDREKAIEATREGLSAHPNHEDGRRFLETLLQGGDE